MAQMVPIGASMRIGFWNRLALVAIALACLIVPTWITLAERNRIITVNSDGYGACMKAAFSQSADGTLSPQVCTETWFRDDQWYPGWIEWWQAVGAILLVCIVIYLLLWAAVGTVKWVWRGRQVDKPAP